MQRRLLIALVIAVFFGLSGVSQAVIIYESATLGSWAPNKVTIAVGDYGVNGVSFAGSRFHIDQAVDVTAIGGNMIRGQSSDGDVFGAIISLSGPTAFPAGLPFNPSEVIASTIFEPPAILEDYRVALSATLAPGDYALIFGSNKLGASGGNMGMWIFGQSWLPGGNLIVAHKNPDSSWFTFDEPARFVVEGTYVPEPATFLLIGLGALLLRKTH